MESSAQQHPSLINLDFDDVVAAAADALLSANVDVVVAVAAVIFVAVIDDGDDDNAVAPVDVIIGSFVAASFVVVDAEAFVGDASKGRSNNTLLKLK